MLTNFNALRLEVARNTSNHVKKTLPPSLNGLPGEAEIVYFVKVTVQRPAFYKENFRSVGALSKHEAWVDMGIHAFAKTLY